MNNDYDRRYETSPQYVWMNSSMAVNTSQIGDFEVDKPASQKYLPFNFTRVVNNGEDDIWFYPNQDTNRGIFIAKGTILSMDKTVIPALRTFKVTNAGTNSATISASRIIVSCHKEALDTESVVQRIARTLFNMNRRSDLV